MDLPAWLTEILRQFPMVVVIGLAVWWTYNRLERREIRQEKLMNDRERRLEEQYEKLRLETRGAADAEIERSERRLIDVIADKNREIDRLTEQVRSDLKKLAKEVDQLTRKPKS